MEDSTGRKYASIHIILENRYSLRQLTGALNGAVDNIGAAFVDALDVPRSPAFNGLFKVMQKMMAGSTLIKENPRGYSLSDGRVGMDNIAVVAKKLSQNFDNDSIFHSCVYDDDVFCFGLCRNDEKQSEHVSGNLQGHGKDEKNEGCDEYRRRFTVPSLEAVSEWETMKGTDFEKHLENHMGIVYDITQ